MVRIFFKTMKLLLSDLKDFSIRCREVRFGSSRIQSANFYTDDILVPHGSLQRINVFLLAVFLFNVPLG